MTVYPRIVRVSAEIRTGNIQNTSQTLLLDHTYLFNEECVFDSLLFRRYYEAKKKKRNTSRRGVRISNIFMKFRAGVLYKKLSRLSFVEIGSVTVTVNFHISRSGRVQFGVRELTVMLLRICFSLESDRCSREGRLLCMGMSCIGFVFRTFHVSSGQLPTRVNHQWHVQ